MAYIRKRTAADGSVSYQAQIVIKKDSVIVHRESKTFSKKQLAKDWAMRRKVELQDHEVYGRQRYIPIREVIDTYIRNFDPSGRSKQFDLKKLLSREIADKNVNKLTALDLIEHITERNKECSPQTAGNDLIWLNTVILTMKPILKLTTDLDIFRSAREILRKEGLIAKSKHRDRLPTRKELWQLSRFFDKKMRHIMWFAIFSARRQSEITELLWSDLDVEHGTIWVRNLKDPRVKGLKKKAKLPRSALKIILRQPRKSDRIFPYKSKTIGSYFTRACQVLEIEDLHFHDLRHYALTRLALQGLGASQMMLVSLHSNITTLQRYINMRPEQLDI